MEERKRGYQGRRLAGATPRQEPERRGSRTRQAEDKARRGRDPWEMTPEETAPITPGDGESVSAGRRAASVAGGKAAPAADFDSMSGSADGTSADSAAGAVDSDAMAGPGEGSGSGRAAVKKKKSRLCRLLVGFRLSHRHGGGGGAGVPGNFAAELGTLRLHGDHHPQKDAADLVAAALCDGRPGAGAGEHRHFLERRAG